MNESYKVNRLAVFSLPCLYGGFNGYVQQCICVYEWRKHLPELGLFAAKTLQWLPIAP